MCGILILFGFVKESKNCIREMLEMHLMDTSKAVCNISKQDHESSQKKMFIIACILEINGNVNAKSI